MWQGSWSALSTYYATLTQVGLLPWVVIHSRMPSQHLRIVLIYIKKKIPKNKKKRREKKRNGWMAFIFYNFTDYHWMYTYIYTSVLPSMYITNRMHSGSHTLDRYVSGKYLRNPFIKTWKLCMHYYKVSADKKDMLVNLIWKVALCFCWMCFYDQCTRSSIVFKAFVEHDFTTTVQETL